MKKFAVLLPVLLILTLCAKQDSEITVQSVNEAQLREIISQRNNRILFLNVWATWCVPCREEFPDIVRLARDYQQKGVDIIGLSADYSDEIDSKIVPFLRQQKVNFPVYVQNFENVDALINSLHSDWSGAIPATFIYDGNGKRRVFIAGQHDYTYFALQLDAVLNG